MASKFSLSRENFTPLIQAGTPSIIQGYSSGGHHLCWVVELRAIPYGRIFSVLTLKAGWTPASSGQKSPSCFSSVHGACVSYLSRVYWLRLNVVLGQPSGPRSGANSQPAPSERGQDKRACVCTSPCELTWVNSKWFVLGKKAWASLALMELKQQWPFVQRGSGKAERRVKQGLPDLPLGISTTRWECGDLYPPVSYTHRVFLIRKVFKASLDRDWRNLV